MYTTLFKDTGVDLDYEPFKKHHKPYRWRPYFYKLKDESAGYRRHSVGHGSKRRN